MYDLQRLRALHAVRHEGSVAGAARRLGYTPSAVSQQIGKLEREVGALLLEKAGRGVILTDAAIVLTDATETILQATEEASAQLEELRDGLSGALRILCFPTAIRGLLGPAIGVLSERAPELAIHVEEAWDQVIEQVDAGYADLAITHDWLDQPLPVPASVTSELLLTDPVDVVLRADHPRAQQASVSIESLLEESWIVDVEGQSICSLWLRTAMAARGRPIRVAHRVNEYPSQLALIAQGSGISLMPMLGRPALPDDVRSVPLRGERPTRRIFAAYRGSSSRRPAIRTVVETLRGVAPGR